MSRQMARDILYATAQASAVADDLVFNPAFPTSGAMSRQSWEVTLAFKAWLSVGSPIAA
ncbi:hypothetical protein [Mesorhizobium huakuii]|uniref:Uncharacterized protein n=1 Tax=Mesorhizobium huakuii TaxID=28104 RepID=A0A7G6SUZ0_9HYPH|nr:hypothetical protein [Mesorhizobium huakuii]QND58322.1 hypothetical protein HB778_18275 [Mesorhizobium huakuii]